MSDRSWKWFKHGNQFDLVAKFTRKNEPIKLNLTVFIETKDKQDARRQALADLQKLGYENIEILKVIAR
jgi:hypothetical protein